jgi:DNA processing protein
MCESAEDVLRELGGRHGVAEPDRSPYDAFDPGAEDLDALRERIAALLSPTPIPRDELVRQTGASAGAVAAALVELAVAERAELLPGGLVASA